MKSPIKCMHASPTSHSIKNKKVASQWLSHQIRVEAANDGGKG